MIGCAVEIGRAFRRAGLDSAGELHSRVDYTPYGVAMHSYAADLNGNGTIDGTDVGIFLTNLNSGSPLEPGDTGYDPDADFSGDGLLGGTATDEFNAFNARYSAYSTGGSNPTVNAGWIDNPTDAGGPDNSVGYDGYWFDLAGAVDNGSTGLYMVRHRVYDPGMGRWGERDPLEYVDGTSVYQYTTASPVRFQDASGLECGECTPGRVKWGASWTTPSMVGHVPDDLEKKLALLQSLIDGASAIHINPFSETAEELLEYTEEGLQKVANKRLLDEVIDLILHSPEDALPFNLLKDHISPVVKRYLVNYMKDQYNLWATLRYKTCECCCPAEKKGQWSDWKVEMELVHGGMGPGTTFSHSADVKPSPVHIREATSRIKDRVTRDAKKAAKGCK